MSSIKIKNDIDSELLIEHSSGNGAVSITSEELSKLKTVGTIAELQSITNPPPTVWCSGYYDDNDGAFGSNIFKWNDSSIDEPNGGTIIKLDGVETGRYELQYSGAVNVKWFGAVSYSTKANALDGESSSGFIQLALSASLSLKTSLYIPSGFYLIDEELVIDHGNVTIFGDGNGRKNYSDIYEGCTTLVTTTTNSCLAIYRNNGIDDADNKLSSLNIEKLTILAGGTTIFDGVRFDHSRGTDGGFFAGGVWSNVSIFGFKNGMSNADYPNSAVGYLSLNNCQIQHNKAFGVDLRLTASSFNNCDIKGNGLNTGYDSDDLNITPVTNAGGGIYLRSSVGVNILGGSYEGQNTGILIVNASKGITISGRYSELNNICSVYLYRSSNITILPEYYSANGAAIVIAQANGVTISDRASTVYVLKAAHNLNTPVTPILKNGYLKTSPEGGLLTYDATPENVNLFIGKSQKNIVERTAINNYFPLDSFTSSVNVTTSTESSGTSPNSNSVVLVTQTAQNGYVSYGGVSTSDVALFNKFYGVSLLQCDDYSLGYSIYNGTTKVFDTILDWSFYSGNGSNYVIIVAYLDISTYTTGQMHVRLTPSTSTTLKSIRTSGTTLIASNSSVVFPRLEIDDYYAEVTLSTTSPNTFISRADIHKGNVIIVEPISAAAALLIKNSGIYTQINEQSGIYIKVADGTNATAGCSFRVKIL